MTEGEGEGYGAVRVSNIPLSIVQETAGAVSGCAAAAALLASRRRWRPYVERTGRDLARIRVVNAITAFVELVIELEEGRLEGGHLLVELGGPARELLRRMVAWNGRGVPPNSIVECAQGCIPFLGTAVERLEPREASESPKAQDLDDLSGQDLEDENAGLRALLERLSAGTRATRVLLFDSAANLVASTHPQEEKGFTSGFVRLSCLHRAPEVSQTLRHMDLFTTVHFPGGFRGAFRMASSRAILVGIFEGTGEVSSFGNPELFHELTGLVEARDSWRQQITPPMPPEEED